MTTRVAINGFGRIGRAFLRILLSQPALDLEVVAVNDLTEPDNLAYLLQFDSAYGRLAQAVSAAEGHLHVGEHKVRVLAERDPAQLPWKDLGIDLVVESTGFFTKREGAVKHLEAGAKKVIISAPAKGPDLTVVMGVNDDQYDPDRHHIVSNASCTTNCLAPVAKVLLDRFGIETGFLTTCHAYTATQAIVDRPDPKDFRRGRSAAVSIVPSSTGAATAVAEVLPALKGKMDGLALRVPTLTGSIVDFVVRTEQPITKEAVNQAFVEAAEGPMRGVLAIAPAEIVSADIVGDPHSSIVDLGSTMTLGDRTVKVLSWYDNEYGYASRVVDLAVKIGAAL
ncbi:type I glyceraldehyde-3-phosphate dehydrogenase [Thermostichus vulcanus]|uniref:Glyceraldehyde-3-phosphate dehydrogenase n=1 Tax=Thermostichus vulcanus str. 'Rupite' TaxID=2813851 RepID=A0ABT0CFH3_THEVL|nr:type I glyceraldehyde-3-phosphate dehydrogenase [Thermostichus vulcanus]MCJ2544105.1 type I glyceraldehyde-3-phosphate dehydrogenase [Thermostichus vulcanus str. 'Rupite']